MSVRKKRVTGCAHVFNNEPQKVGGAHQEKYGAHQVSLEEKWEFFYFIFYPIIIGGRWVHGSSEAGFNQNVQLGARPGFPGPAQILSTV